MNQEIADFQEADQFQYRDGQWLSQFECGYYACAMARSMAQIGQQPTLTMQQVIDDAESWYALYDGSDAISNLQGMTLDQEYALLTQIGLHYQSVDATAKIVAAWIADGYAALLAIVELSVFDVALDRNPYPWTPRGTHVILVTGVTDKGEFLVRDSANVSSLYDTNSLRGGPRTYDATRLQIVTATVVVPPWLSRPTSAIAPTMAPLQNEEEMFHFLSIDEEKDFFEQKTPGDNNNWKCKQTGVIPGGHHLTYFRWNGGVTTHGLPETQEEHSDPEQHPEVTLVKYERRVNRYDPHYVYDRPVMEPAQPVSDVYPAKLTDKDVLHLIAPTPAPVPTPVVAPVETPVPSAEVTQALDELHTIEAQEVLLKQEIETASATIIADEPVS